MNGTVFTSVGSIIKILEISRKTALIFLFLIIVSGSFWNINRQLPASAIRWNHAIGTETTTDKTTKNRMISFFDFSLRSFILQSSTAQLIARYRSIAMIMQNQAVKL